MKHKLLKRIFILTQVLGLSALAATACTDNKAQAASTTSSTTQEKTPPPTTQAKETITPTLQVDQHLSGKQKVIKAAGAVTKGLVNVGTAVATGLEIYKDPAHAKQYIEGNSKAASKLKAAVDKKTQTSINKAAEQAAAKKDNDKDDKHSSLQHLKDAITSKLPGHGHKQP